MSDTVTAAVKDSQAPFGALGERGLWPAFHRGVFECSSTKASTEIHNTKSEFGDSNQCTVGLFWCAPRCAPWHVRLAARLSPSAPDLTFCVLTCPPLDPRFPGAALAHPPLSALPPPPRPSPCPQVLVLRLLTRDSIEEHVLRVAEQKRKFTDSSITGEAGPAPAAIDRRGSEAGGWEGRISPSCASLLLVAVIIIIIKGHSLRRACLQPAGQRGGRAVPIIQKPKGGPRGAALPDVCAGRLPNQLPPCLCIKWGLGGLFPTGPYQP